MLNSFIILLVISRQADVIFEYLYGHGGLHILNHTGLLESEAAVEADVGDDDIDDNIEDEV